MTVCFLVAKMEHQSPVLRLCTYSCDCTPSVARHCTRGNGFATEQGSVWQLDLAHLQPGLKPSACETEFSSKQWNVGVGLFAWLFLEWIQNFHDYLANEGHI